MLVYFEAEDGRRGAQESDGLGDVYEGQMEIVLGGVTVAVPMVEHGQHGTNRAVDRGLV